MDSKQVEHKPCNTCGGKNYSSYKNCGTCRASWREDKRVTRQSRVHKLEEALKLIKNEAIHASKRGEFLRMDWLENICKEALK